jgi:hypothetical protein
MKEMLPTTIGRDNLFSIKIHKNFLHSRLEHPTYISNLKALSNPKKTTTNVMEQPLT